MFTDAKKLKYIQWKFVAPCQNYFFTLDHVTHEDFFFLIFKPSSLRDRRLRLDALFFISVYSGLKHCPSLLDITGIQILPNFRNSSLFTVTCKDSPSVGCVLATNLVCKDAAILFCLVCSVLHVRVFVLFLCCICVFVLAFSWHL